MFRDVNYFSKIVIVFLKKVFCLFSIVQQLLLEYPEPVKLFFDVMKPLIEADPSLTSHLVVSRHLKNIYWKAQLQFKWQNTICVTGVNSDRDLAIEHAFLLACVQLQVNY